MFGLTEAEVLAGAVLDCPGGAGPFAAKVRAGVAGGERRPPPRAAARRARRRRSAPGSTTGTAYLGENRESYVWTFFSALEDLRRRRGAALDEFATYFHGARRPVRRGVPTCRSPTGRSGSPSAPTSCSPTLTTSTRTPTSRPRGSLLVVATEEVRVFPLIDRRLRPGTRASRTCGDAAPPPKGERGAPRVDYGVPPEATRCWSCVPPRLSAQPRRRLASFEKKLQRGAGLGLLCRSGRCPLAERLAFIATWSASAGAHFVDSSRMREPSG